VRLPVCHRARARWMLLLSWRAVASNHLAALGYHMLSPHMGGDVRERRGPQLSTLRGRTHDRCMRSRGADGYGACYAMVPPSHHLTLCTGTCSWIFIPHLAPTHVRICIFISLVRALNHILLLQFKCKFCI